MEWVFKAEQMHASITSPRTVPKVRLSGVKLADIGHWSSGNLFCGGMNLCLAV